MKRTGGQTVHRAALALGLTLLVGFCSPAGGSEAASGAAAPVPLQKIIDEAAPGSTISLKAGTYAGPVTIDKPLTLVAESEGTVRLVDGGGEHVVSIRSPEVSLKGLDIAQSRPGETSAVAVEAGGASLEALTIRTEGHGIRLREADEATLRGNRIAWTGDTDTGAGRKSNGIDLYGSHGARIEANEIDGMRDGIYLENSHNAEVRDNRVYRSRYGIHCMYADGTRIVGNEGEGNVTGAMVMGVRDAIVQGNTFRKQSENVHSQGILLFDVRTSRIEDNVVEGNRVGLYMEQSSDNELRRNGIVRNFIGIQFLESEGNRFSDNRFVSNVIEAEATDSAGNAMDGNYWDAVRGLDADGDGRSELSYPINPFYRKLVDRKPAFQLFFQSPGMVYLSELFSSDRVEWARDASPLMREPAQFGVGSPSGGGADSLGVGLLGLALFGVSTFILIKGAGRK